METNVIFTGVGGQGVQLAAQILGRAAVAEGLHVVMLGTYGGTMRGGNTDCTVIVADHHVETPPILARTDAGLVMHHAFWGPLRDKLAPDALLLVNSSVFEGDLDGTEARVFEVPATTAAADLGSAMAASLVMLGAYGAATELVSTDALVAAMRESLPPYRAQHADRNESAIRAGVERVDAGAASVWNRGEA